MSKEDAITLLSKSKEVLQEYGWIRGVYGDCASGFCARGAMWKANSELWPDGFRVEADTDAVNILHELLTEKTGSEFMTVPVFNDRLAAGMTEILALFDDAITRAAHS